MLNHIVDFFATVLSYHLSQINLVLYIFMVVGVAASSISGVFRAIESKMDITGAILLAFINSNAGGTVRDLILGTSVFWVSDQFYIWMTFIIGAITYIIVYFKKRVINSKKLYRLLIITDAMGLAAFCLAGVQKTLSVDPHGRMYTIAIMMGIWTAIGGGVIADIIANRVPLVFSQELYVTVAFIGALLFLTLVTYCGINMALAGLIAALVMVIIRIYSVKYKIRLPLIK